VARRRTGAGPNIKKDRISKGEKRCQKKRKQRKREKRKSVIKISHLHPKIKKRGKASIKPTQNANKKKKAGRETGRSTSHE
jgi:hypothetical protein